MSEESTVTLIGMILSAGVLAPGIGWLNRRLGDGEAKPAPVTTADADAVHAHQSQQLVLASLNAMGAALASTQGDLEDTRGDLAQEQERTSGLERTVESLRRSQGQDGALIRTLTAWARDMYTRWPALRLSETPPPLSDTINQPPGSPGASS